MRSAAKFECCCMGSVGLGRLLWPSFKVKIDNLFHRKVRRKIDQAAIPCTPLETLYYGVLDWVQQHLVDFGWQCVVDQNVGAWKKQKSLNEFATAIKRFLLQIRISRAFCTLKRQNTGWYVAKIWHKNKTISITTKVETVEMVEI